MLYKRRTIGTLRAGSVLVLVLWVVIFLTMLAVGSSMAVRNQLIAAENLASRTALNDLLYSAALSSVDRISIFDDTDETPGADTLIDRWAVGEADFRDNRFGDGIWSAQYSTINDVTGQNDVRYGLIDEERKININTADKDTIARIFSRMAGMNNESASYVAKSIIDWRDNDDSSSNTGEGTSERVWYSNKSITYMPSNARFRFPEEIMLVYGMTTERFVKIRPVITVYGTGKVNINTASRVVLELTGLDKLLVDKIVSFRAGHDMIEGTDDDTFFSAVSKLAEELAGYCDLTSDEIDALKERITKGVFDIRSSTFTACITAELKGSKRRGKIICTFDRGKTIKYWGTL